jgi:uncharacterized protein
MLTSAVLRMVGFCTRYPWPVIVVAAMLAVGSALYTAAHFAITTDTDQLLPKDLPWRQHEQAYKDAFPQDQILVVVQGPDDGTRGDGGRPVGGGTSDTS